MSKDSIRDKITKLQQESEAILKTKNLNADVRFFIQSMMSILEIVVAVLLEKKTRKNSSNSGLPPSKNNGSNGNRNKNSGQRANLGDQIQNTRNITNEEVTTPAECSNCGIDLSQEKSLKSETRKKIDILYEIITTVVTAKIVECPKCGEINKGPFPKDMNGPLQYGIGIKAMIINFSIVQMMSLERIQEYLKGLIGGLISQAIMLKYIAQLSSALAEWEKRNIEKLLRSPAIHCDETSVKVNKVNYWIHSYSAGDLTLQFVHANRGTEAINDIGIIPHYGGILVHDCWASYLTYNHVDHGLCGSHLLRELKFIEDSTLQKWATKMKKLLQAAAIKLGERTTTIPRENWI
ncbi:MAG: transposase [Oligoflexia bacterium]|nr:transposase [Oligoflexia bacterium]